MPSLKQSVFSFQPSLISIVFVCFARFLKRVLFHFSCLLFRSCLFFDRLLNRILFHFRYLLFRSFFFVAAVVHGTTVSGNYIFFGTCFYCGCRYFPLPITRFCLDCLLRRLLFCLALSYVWRVCWSCRVTGSPIPFQSFSHSSLLSLFPLSISPKKKGLRYEAKSLEPWIRATQWETFISLSTREEWAINKHSSRAKRRDNISF